MELNVPKILGMMEERGLNKSELARLMGVSRQRINELFHFPDGFHPKTVRKLAIILQTSPLQLLKEKEKRRWEPLLRQIEKRKAQRRISERERKLTPRKKEIVKLLKEGYKKGAIAKKFGVSPYHLRMWLKEQGLQNVKE